MLETVFFQRWVCQVSSQVVQMHVSSWNQFELCPVVNKTVLNACVYFDTFLKNRSYDLWVITFRTVFVVSIFLFPLVRFPNSLMLPNVLRWNIGINRYILCSWISILSFYVILLDIHLRTPRKNIKSIFFFFTRIMDIPKNVFLSSCEALMQFGNQSGAYHICANVNSPAGLPFREWHVIGWA